MDKYLFWLEVLCAICLIWPVKSQLKDMDFNWMLSGVNNYTDLCEYMAPADCQNLIEEMEFIGQVGDKVAVSGKGPQIATFDACNPRMQTIAIPRHPDPEIIIWPPCTRAKRCGGCCTSDVFSCEPTDTVDRYVKVFDTKLAYPGAQRFKFVGIRNVRIVEHTQCDAQCKTKPHNCHKYQIYKYRKCRCECSPERLKLRSTCHKNQRWDDSECDCICPNRATIECPPPFRFSTTICKCTIKTEVTGDEINMYDIMSQLDINMIKVNRNQDNGHDTIDRGALIRLAGGGGGRNPFNDNGDGNDDDDEDTTEAHLEEVTTPTTTTTTTEATTTTTEPTTTTEKITTTTKKPKPGCKHITCSGRNWEAMRMKNDRCVCLPPVAIARMRNLH